MFKGILWNLFEKLSNHGISFVLSIFLARLLTPAEFGLIGMVFVIVGMSHIFLDMGFSASLVQRQDLTSKHYSSVFYLNIFIGFVISAIVFAASGLIADFYGYPELKVICQALSPIFLLNALGLVQNSQFSKKMDFRTPSLIRVFATVASGGVGVLMAYQGFGVWSLVAQNLLSSGLFSIGLWVFSKWKPKLEFEMAAIKDLWGFGGSLFASGILEAIFNRADMVLIGRLFSASALGFYSRAQTVNYMVIQYSSGTLARVFFPALSKIQHDNVKVTNLYLKALALVSFLVFGLLGGLYLASEDLFVLLFTAKWLPSIEYFRIMVLAGYAYPVGTIMVNLLCGKGNTKAFLRLEIAKKVFLVIALICGYFYGIKGFLYASVVVSVFTTLLGIIFVKWEIGVSIMEQSKMILLYFFAGLVSVGLVMFIDPYLLKDRLIHMALVSVIFGLSYLLINFVVRSSAFLFLANKLKLNAVLT